jgi:hypothetical protein
MSALAAARRYFDAWNARSAEGIVAAIQPGGTYEDPMTGGPLGRDEISRYAGNLFEAFPDLAFEFVSQTEIGPNSAALLPQANPLSLPVPTSFRRAATESPP